MRLSLAAVPIFAGLEENALDVLLEQAKRETYPAGAVIVREEESSNRMFVIEDGTVRIARSFGEKTEVEFARFGAGDFFGEMCILEPLPREATAQAVTEVTLISISSFGFYHLYQKMPAQYSVLILNIARDLCRRLRKLDEVFAAKH